MNKLHALGLAFLLTASPAFAQTTDPMAEVNRLYTLGAAVDVCELDISDAELGKLEAAIEAADAATKKDSAELEALYDKIQGELEKDKDAVCKGKSAEFLDAIKKLK